MGSRGGPFAVTATSPRLARLARVLGGGLAAGVLLTLSLPPVGRWGLGPAGVAVAAWEPGRRGGWRGAGGAGGGRRGVRGVAGSAGGGRGRGGGSRWRALRVEGGGGSGGGRWAPSWEGGLGGWGPWTPTRPGRSRRRWPPASPCRRTRPW